MPVYIRKNVSFTPPSIYNMQLEDDNDYLLDPDQMRDILPQPYRMINKILTQIIESAWDIIEGKEQAILAEAQKVRPPRYSEPDELSIYDNATALAESVDGKFIFIGHPKGFAVIDALSQDLIHKWDDDNAEITSIKSYVIGQNCHLITTLDDMAVCRLFLFAVDRIFIVKTMNENSPDSTSNILCQKCEASQEGDYLGIVMENTSTKENWFEAHKLPVDSWTREFENIQAAISKQKEEYEKDPTEIKKEPTETKKDNTETKKEPAETKIDNTETKETSEEKVAEPVEEQIDTSNNKNAPDIKNIPATVQSEGMPTIDAIIEKMGIKFTHPTVVLKIKSPSILLPAANTSSSIGSAVSKVDQGDVLGVGLSHVMSATHLESRDVMFQHQHESMLEYLSAKDSDVTMSASFHFVNPSRLMSSALEQPSPMNKPVSVIVWWTGTPHLCHYSLTKTGKDLEFKPDIVWPFSSNITCSASSPCATHVAIGLENGNITLFDYRMGLTQSVLNVSSTCSLKTVRFLDPALFPSEIPNYPPYPVSSATFVLAECADGSQSLYDTCDGSQQIPRCIASCPENEDEVQTLLQSIPALPELMVYVQRNGHMYIKDIGTGASLCEIAVPPTHSIKTPWDPIFALGGGGQILYLKGEGTDVNEDGESSDISHIFKYSLRSYPILDEYWARNHDKKELSVYTMHEQRLDELMKERLQQQAARKPRMQKRWGQLRSELGIIQHAHAIPVESLRLSTLPSLQSLPEALKNNQKSP